MGMNTDQAIAKASEIMWRYRISKDDQVAVIKILMDAGVERCLEEQQRIRDENAVIIDRVTGLVH